MTKFAFFAAMVMMSSISIRVSADPDMLQDICVADLTSTAPRTNGFPCKPSTAISSSDFFFAGLAKPGNTDNPAGSIPTLANVLTMPGLNTLGLSFSRIDYRRGGLNPPHTHPRATELLIVLEGQLYVGFITTGNVLYSRIIKKGEVFVFPKGLIHFQLNNGTAPAVAITAFNSQLPGVMSVGVSLFGKASGVPDDVLAKTFRVGDNIVERVKDKFKS